MKRKRVYDMYGTFWHLLVCFMATTGAIFSIYGAWEAASVTWACAFLGLLAPTIRQDIFPMPGDPGYGEEST